MLWRAAASPARARVSNWCFSCSLKIGSSAVFTPQSSTLLYIPVPSRSFELHREYGRQGRKECEEIFSRFAQVSSSCFRKSRMIRFSNLEM